MSVRLAKQLGLSRIVQTARRLGMKSPLPDDLTIVLGTGETTLLELTTAYAIIARGGLSVKPYAITKVTDPQGQVLYRHQSMVPERVIAASVAQELTHMMEAVIAYGSGKKAALGRPCAGKTGTTQLYRDAWFIGFTPEFITGVWAGNDDNTSLDPTPGSPSVKLWRLYMIDTPSTPVAFPREAIPASQPSSGGLLDGLIDSLFGE